MSDPTDKMIEAGRMALVDATGHGYGPELVRAVYAAMQAVAPYRVPGPSDFELCGKCHRILGLPNVPPAPEGV